MNKQCGLCLLKTDMQEVVNKFDTLNRKQCDIILVGKVNTSLQPPVDISYIFVQGWGSGFGQRNRIRGSVPQTKGVFQKSIE